MDYIVEIITGSSGLILSVIALVFFMIPILQWFGLIPLILGILLLGFAIFYYYFKGPKDIFIPPSDSVIEEVTSLEEAITGNTVVSDTDVNAVIDEVIQTDPELAGQVEAFGNISVLPYCSHASKLPLIYGDRLPPYC